MEEKIERNNKELLGQFGNHSEMAGDLKQLSQKSWEEICEYRRLLDALDYQKCLLKLEKIKDEQLR